MEETNIDRVGTETAEVRILCIFELCNPRKYLSFITISLPSYPCDSFMFLLFLTLPM